ncbi:MAG: hypothetical protein KC776_43785 [Myxococcales bacterium]|nr:hypothetical protein [Myxococcales bacterium]MCB9576443.1 hypothetical protein [Polyangiaceae bacterium]
MSDRIRELVKSVEAQGVDSPYLERLRRPRGQAEAAIASLQHEIVGEMAASLGRAEDHINEALLRLDLLGRELDRGERPELVEEFNAQRKVAERRVWELRVQREALGIRRNEMLAKLYPIPPRR